MAQGVITQPAECLGPMQVARLTGLSYRQLKYWDRIGVLTPHKNTGRPGRRTYRSYTPEHVATLVVLAELRSMGRSVQSMHGLARSLTEELGTSRYPEDWEGAFLVVTGQQWSVQWDSMGRYPSGDIAAWWAAAVPGCLLVDLCAVWKRVEGREPAALDRGVAA